MPNHALADPTHQPVAPQLSHVHALGVPDVRLQPLHWPYKDSDGKINTDTHILRRAICCFNALLLRVAGASRTPARLRPGRLTSLSCAPRFIGAWCGRGLWLIARLRRWRGRFLTRPAPPALLAPVYDYCNERRPTMRPPAHTV